MAMGYGKSFRIFITLFQWTLFPLTITANVSTTNIHYVTSISLYQLVLLDALQLATGATGLFSQGVTAVVHGCSVCALDHNLGEETGFTMATLQEGSENARNHTRLHSWTIYCFINLIQLQTSTEGWNQQSWLSSNISMKPCKVYNKLGLQHLYPLIVVYWNYCRKNYFTLGILYRGGVWTRSGVIKAGAKVFERAQFPWFGCSSLEGLQSSSTALLPEKFHCMGEMNSLVSNLPFLRSHGQPRYI